MDKDLIQSVIGRIATGPDLSKNISFDEAKSTMNAILRGDVSDVRVAVIFIALRMKRETEDENNGILSAILEQTDTQIANVDNLVDLGDPYSGYNRSVPVSGFLPPLLAELGLPTIIHGLNSVSPKYGLTHHHVQLALGINPEISTFDAKNKIENADIGWSYLDQKIFCKGLHDIVPLRNEIIKRSVINTIEALAHPIRGKINHSILGYVHKTYPPIYANLADLAGFDTALLVRGIEGGVVPSLRQQGLMISYLGKIEQKRVEIDPKELGIKQEIRAITMPLGLVSEQAKLIAEMGLQAISGKKSAFYDGLVYAASLILWHTKKTDSLQTASDMVRNALDSGNIITRIK